MSLNVLDNKFRINLANNDLNNILTKYSAKSVTGKVQYEIFKDNSYVDFDFLQNIFYLKNLGIWFSYIKKYNRHIYVFGSDKPKTSNNKPFCIIDFPDSGINKDTTAVFAQDKNGRVSILYRVNQNNLNCNSFELDIEEKWIQAKEDGINNYFISIGEFNSPNFIKSFQKFIVDYEKIISSNGSDKPLKENLCENCGNTISFIKSDNKIINEYHSKNKNLCRTCLEKLACDYVNNKIKEKIKVTVFNMDSLIERVDEPDLYESYVKFLLELGYLKEINKNLFIFNNSSNDKKGSLNIDKTEKPVKEQKLKEEKCVKCGVILSSNNSIKSRSKIISDKCKDCSRKIYAVKALNHLEEYVDPDVSFNKDDLLKQVDNKTRFLDYIWTLEEYSLLEKDNENDYILKPDDVLQKFKDKYGEVTNESKKETTTEPVSKGKQTKKIIKECKTCHQKLPISNFYKAGDGYTDKCKECSRKFYAVKAIIEFKKYVMSEVEFLKDDLLKQVENTTQILDYFWTLQDFDFIEHNEKNDSYILKSEKELNSFIEKYGDKSLVEGDINEIPAEDTPKTVKECLTCKKVLPVSNFYKSSESNDGLTVNCKKCSDKLNAASILSEITNQIGIGFPFSKKDISSRLGNPNKANYYIWILLEHDLIDHNDSTDTFIIEDKGKYQEYIKLIPKNISEETSTTPIEENPIESEENTILKDIIYISEISDLNNYRTVVLRGIVQNNVLYLILEEIKNIVTSNMTNMNCDRYKEDLIKIIVELDIENEKFEETLNYLHSHSWKKF